MFKFLATIMLSFYCSLAFAGTPVELVEAPLSDFVQWATTNQELDVLIPEPIEGTVTINIHNIEDNEILPLLETVLTSNGYQLDLDGTLYTIQKSSFNLNEEPEPEPEKVFVSYEFENISNVKGQRIFNSILAALSTKGGFSCVLSPSANIVLVHASEDLQKELTHYQPVIDVLTPQILIEAVILETDLTGNKDVGVNLASALMVNGFTVASNTFNAGIGATGLLGGSVVFNRGGDIRGLVNALNKDSRNKILSTPKILVLDRESGLISVGQNVPFLIGTETTEGGGVIQKIQRKDVGVSLQVKPFVLGQNIQLDILQESSSVTTSTAASDIITNTRRIKTIANLINGQTLFLGGLVSEENREGKTRVPLVSDIPVLGHLFKYEFEENVQRELSVLLKAEII